ncbi:hypothetical protein [Celeribacter neptunius]|uniref:Uncharacterized protein n=1 Tax=Celeribacter neptunius TaxID=588602 RepID=A0A1I3JBS3_9RHOB|nr:hypothetical protein [Celeribacter neptunius]SFI57663.1 hypothetical protein SAMN04487991_0304 [Celeribacter neptunius]
MSTPPTEPPAPEPDSTYPQGYDAITAQLEAERVAFVDLDGNLPDPEMDFAPLKTRILPPRGDCELRKPAPERYRENVEWMAYRLANQPELFHLTAVLIMLSRRRPFDPQMQRLWHRLWDEEAEFLTKLLSPRWKISALRTFGDFGRTEAERRLGRDMFLVTGMMKLADSERNFSGLSAAEHFPLGKRKNDAVSLGLEPYSVSGGDLDIHIIHHLHESVTALDGTGAGLLGQSLLDEINASPRTVFRRLMVIRDKFRRARARRAAKQS